MPMPPEMLRIEAEIGFQRRVWRAERLGWAAMAALVLAACAGLFGGGGVLAGRQVAGGGVELDWPSLIRLGRTETAILRIPAGEGEAELRLEGGLALQWRLHGTTPPASRIGAGGGAGGGETTLRFTRAADGTAVVALHLEPIGRPGARRLVIGAAGQRFDLPVFVWP